MGEYSATEERINVYSHLLGTLLGLIALFFLSVKSLDNYNLATRISLHVFGLSLVLLYLASTLYHSATEKVIRHKRKVFDHCAIYILIAGSYTPYTLGAIGGSYGWMVFGIVWFMAIVGITLKLFFTGRYKFISTLMYVLMGWMIVFFIKPLKLAISEEGFNWLLYGGISYSIGAVIYMIKSIKFNHAIFHIFVLGGSICHFISIYFYI